MTFDTTRADAVGYATGRADVTPNLDRLAAAGTWFSTCITAQPLTVPAHSTIMTGLFPFHHGVRNNGTYVLSPNNVTLAEMLRNAGYSTHAVVSSFVLDRQFGLNQGFDVYDDDLSGGPQQKMFMFREIKANQTADKAIRWLTSGRPTDKPFFLWVHFFDPHADYEPPPDIGAKFPGEKYEAEVSFADRELGRVLATLEKLGLRRNTLVIMTGDHGESLGDHGEKTHGIFVYDSTIHVPLLFSGPRVPAGRRVDPLVRTADIVPTIMALLKLPMPQVDGAPLVGLMNGRKEPPRVAYSESFAPRLNFGWAELRAQRSQEMKFIDSAEPEVYDLRRDTGETSNLYNANSIPASARPLVAELRAIERGDPWQHVRSSQAQLDEESRRKLAALGYVVGAETKDSAARPDAKTRINVWDEFEQAQEAIRQHQYVRAAGMVRAVLAVDRDNVVAMASMANVQAKLNDRAGALETYRRMIDIDPERDNGYLGASRILRDMGHFQEAEAYARTAMRLTPESPESCAALGDVLIDENHFADAEAMFRRAVSLDPHSSTAISGLGNCLNRAGRLREALAVLRDGHEHDPTSQALTYNLAVVVERLGDPDGAKKLYEESIKLDPGHSMSWNNLGALYDRMGNRDEAIRCVTRARQAEPTNVEAAYNLGVLLARSGKPADALPNFQDALRLSPSFVPAAVQYARVLTMLDRKPEALKIWEQLTRVQPAAWLQVARLQMELGNETLARDAVRQGIEHGGNDVRQAAARDEHLRGFLPSNSHN
ncbi:MAG TPA: sulfatase-like hydrolase/transferase [Vicinamibacterales bacterium]|nr:sulfatase-like hydrolase/transferase [Vicinamibacterales bacterium]